MNQPRPASDFALTTREPSVAYQIWTRIRKEPQLATNLTVDKVHALQEFRHLDRNVVSASVSDLCERGFLSQIDKVGQALVYCPGAAFNDPTLKFRHRVVGGTRDRKPGYKVARGDRPEFQLSPQAGLDLGPNRARDEARQKQLLIARALPVEVLEIVLAEKRRAKDGDHD